VIDDGLLEELSALIDGALPEERAKELRRRIREDKELSREYAELERAVLAVRALPRRGTPPELRARIDASLRPRRGRILRFGALAVAATVLLAVGLALYLGRGGTPAHFEAKDDEPAGRRDAPAEPPAPVPADRLEGKDDSALLGAREEAQDERAKEEAAGAKLGKSRGAPAKKQEAVDLLAAAEKSRRVPGDRKAYLRQLVALEPAKAREHVRAVVGDVGTEFRQQPRDGSPPVLAEIRLADREEATLVKRILGTAPVQNAAAALAVEQAPENLVTTDVSGTPDDLARLARWLALLDLAPPKGARPRVQVFGEAKREADEEPEVETAVVRLSFGKPPEPKPEETPSKGK
jgi:hypothetical protein